MWIVLFRLLSEDNEGTYLRLAEISGVSAGKRLGLAGYKIKTAECRLSLIILYGFEMGNNVY